MRQAQHTLEVHTRGRGMQEVTAEVAHWLLGQNAKEGLLVLFIQHTSASLLVQENADPSVQADLDRFLSSLVKDGDPMFAHNDEGPDDMPSHVRAALTQTQLTVPVREGRMLLGTWQGLFVFEHRRRPHVRRVVLHYLGT